MLISSINMFAQESDLVFHNYTKEDGLPSSEVYRSFQDEKGFMWFCTDRGMSRYNGFDFENFTTEDGLTDNVITSFYQETPSKFWLLCNNGTLTILEHGKFSAFDHNDKIKEYHPSLRYLSIIIKNNEIFVHNSGYKTFIINAEGEITPIFKFNKNISQVYDIKNNFLFMNLEKPFSIEFKIDSSLIIYDDTTYISIPLKDVGNAADIHNSKIHILEKGIFAYSYKNKILLIKGKKVIQELTFNSKIIYFSFEHGKLWLGLLKNGAFELKYNNNRLKIKRKLISNLSVSNIFIDREKSLWITTLNKGVFYSINPSISFLRNTTNKEILYGNELKRIASNIFISDPNGYFYKYNTILDTIDYAHQFNKNISSISYFKNSNCFIDANFTYNFNIETKSLETIGELSTTTFISKRKLIKRQGNWYSIGNRFLFKFSDGILSIKKIYESVIYDLEENINGTIFIADKNGLLTLIKDSIVPLISGVRVNDIESTMENILCASRGRGLIFYSKNSNKNYKIKDGIISNQLNHINKTTEFEGWISSNEGISQYQINTNNITFNNYTKSHGLPSDEIFHAVSCDSILFVGSKKGLIKTHLNKLKNTFNSNLFLYSIVLNQDTMSYEDIKVITKSTLELTSNKNSIEINLAPLCLNCLDDIEIKVEINGDKQLIKTTKLTLSSLQPNNYNIRFWIKNSNNRWIKANFELNFIIPQSFWLSPFFLILTFITILIILGVLVYFYNKRSKRRLLEKQESLKFQQSALISQMKPHFIFNSLNSIQHKILQDDKFETHRFVSQFGLLMRKNLDYSEKEFITLEEEIDLIKLYLEIENKRLKNKITLNISINNIPNPRKSKIAPFILQPIIENSIWHGLTKVDDENLLLNISFIKSSDKLTVEIVDNGIGINKTIDNKKTSHESKGSKILKKRLQLLEVKYKYKTSYFIQDLSEENKRGTRVTITLPIIE